MSESRSPGDVPTALPSTPCVVRVLSGRQTGAEEPLSAGDRLIVGGDLNDDLVLVGVTHARVLIRLDEEGKCLLTALRSGAVYQGQPLHDGAHIDPLMPALLALDGVMLGIGPRLTDWTHLRAQSQPVSESGQSSRSPDPSPQAPASHSATLMAQVLITGLLAAMISAGLYWQENKNEFLKKEQVAKLEDARQRLESVWTKTVRSPHALEWKPIDSGWELKAMVANDAEEAQLKNLLLPLGKKISARVCNLQDVERALRSELSSLKPLDPSRMVKIESQQSDKPLLLDTPWELFPKVRPALLRLTVANCASAEIKIKLRGMWFAVNRQEAVFSVPLSALNRHFLQSEFAGSYFDFVLTGPNAVRQIRLDAPASLLVGPTHSNRRLTVGATLPASEGNAQIVGITREGVYLRNGPWIRLEAGV